MKPLYNYTPYSLANLCKPNKVHRTCIGYTEAKISTNNYNTIECILCTLALLVFWATYITALYNDNKYSNVYCSDYNLASCLSCICISIQKMYN